MAVFEYTAKNTTSGQIMKGTLDVAGKDDVMAYLKKNRLLLVTVREQSKQITFKMPGSGGVNTRDLVIFTRQFATMINAGLPLVQSLTILAAQTENKALKDIVKQVGTTSRPVIPWPTRSGNIRRPSPTSMSTWWRRAKPAVFSTPSCSGWPLSSKRATP